MSTAEHAQGKAFGDLDEAALLDDDLHKGDAQEREFTSANAQLAQSLVEEAPTPSITCDTVVESPAATRHEEVIPFEETAAIGHAASACN